MQYFFFHLKQWGFLLILGDLSALKIQRCYFHRSVHLFHYILWFSVKRLTKELLDPWQNKRILTSPFVFDIFWLPCLQSHNNQLNFCGSIFNCKRKRHLLYNYFFFGRPLVLWSTEPKLKFNKLISSPENPYFSRGQVASRS